METHQEDLGTVKAGKLQEFSIGIDKSKEIKNINISCGCTKVQPVFITGDEPVKVLKVLKVKYTPSAVPKHLKRDWYQASQKVTLTYEDNSQFKLTFTARVEK